MVKKEWIEKGFVDEPVDATLDLKQEIRRLCKEKDAIILAHYYTVGDIQDIADFVGDSLALARKAAETDAKVMVMCGVHFMAETCKLLSPDKTVLCPDLNAGCSLADSCKAEDLKQYKAEHPGYKVVSYVNTTAAVKALTDCVVTSGNAKKVIDSFPQDEKIIFGPDYNLGNYINSPGVTFYPVPPEVSEGGLGCSCNECEYMKMNTLQKIYNALKYDWPTVEVDEAIARDAVKPIEKMLSLS